ncbi:hypothetical protein A2850_04960 [Candidatus Azambacteria bacterium RIFCSPHIGHO2_01_FULL_51_74]|nr:MAG: hypothetical protein A2850_04960 [Candidatus Azambacteria bacterium RIFCSPHIGHO2_01_FULL_51_74]
MMKIETLGNMIDVVEKHWPFDETTYPELHSLSQEQKNLFTLKHILFHQIKAVAKLTEVCEVVDHGKSLDGDKLHVAVRNFFINTLRLTRAAGYEEDGLKTLVRLWVEEKHQP